MKDIAITMALLALLIVLPTDAQAKHKQQTIRQPVKKVIEPVTISSAWSGCFRR
jgi:hypothetical protein